MKGENEIYTDQEWLRTAADDIRRGYSFSEGWARRFEDIAERIDSSESDDVKNWYIPLDALNNGRTTPPSLGARLAKIVTNLRSK